MTITIRPNTKEALIFRASNKEGGGWSQFARTILLLPGTYEIARAHPDSYRLQEWRPVDASICRIRSYRLGAGAKINNDKRPAGNKGRRPPGFVYETA